MKHVKKSVLFVVCVFVSVALLFAAFEGLTLLLLFPVAAIAAFAWLYIVKQNQKDVENNIKDGVRYEIEEEEAEQWIKHDLAPKTLSYIEQKHWPIIIYGFIFVVGMAFLWSYLTIGSESAIQNSMYTAVLFVSIVVYTFIGPLLFNSMYRFIPKPLRKFARNDWVRGYLFLLPLTAIGYVLSPFIGLKGDMMNRISALPAFLLGYTLLFVAGYAIFYLRNETKKEEQKELKKSVKEYLQEK
jgi:hypothetical protein